MPIYIYEATSKISELMRQNGERSEMLKIAQEFETERYSADRIMRLSERSYVRSLTFLDKVKHNKDIGKCVASLFIVSVVALLFIFIPPSTPAALIIGPGFVLFMMWRPYMESQFEPDEMIIEVKK